MRLANKVALITGGGRGIGKAVALAYARQGAALALCARTGAELDQTCQEIRSLNAECVTWTCDVSLEEAVKELVANVTRKSGIIALPLNDARVTSCAVCAPEIDVNEWKCATAVA